MEVDDFNTVLQFWVWKKRKRRVTFLSTIVHVSM